LLREQTFYSERSLGTMPLAYGVAVR
jgi:hypothetical protein